MEAKSGETVKLSATGTSDPDGDNVSYLWFQYRGVGSYKGRIEIENSQSQEASFVAPDVDSPETIHIILWLRTMVSHAFIAIEA